jgi:hypothetical protein
MSTLFPNRVILCLYRKNGIQPSRASINALGIQDNEVHQKVYPLMVILTAGRICFVLISPPGELTSMVCFMIVMGRLRFTTNDDDIKECDASESNKTVAGCELTKNIPNTTS